MKFSVGPIENSTIEDFDQTTSFDLVTDEENSLVRASAEFETHLDGFIHKSDWYAEDSGRFGSPKDWSKHYLQISAGVCVRAVVEIDTSGDEPEPISVELHDLEPSEPSMASVLADGE